MIWVLYFWLNSSIEVKTGFLFLLLAFLFCFFSLLGCFAFFFLGCFAFFFLGCFAFFFLWLVFILTGLGFSTFATIGTFLISSLSGWVFAQKTSDKTQVIFREAVKC